MIKKQNVDLSKILVGLDGKWVILSEDFESVLAVSEDSNKFDSDLLNSGFLMRVPPQGVAYAPVTL